MSNEDRKARLKALREAAARKEQGYDATKQDDKSPDKPSTLKFRNYIVKDESIKHEKVEQRKVVDDDIVEVDLEKTIGVEPAEVIAKVAPKKPNWDIRREIAGKLAKLERKTQRAIAELAIEEEKKRMNA